MGTRYGEAVEVDVEHVTAGPPRPVRFRWRGRSYEVAAVLGHWCEDAGRYRGQGVDVPQRDLWRVETRARPHGVYELVRDGSAWRLAQIWD